MTDPQPNNVLNIIGSKKIEKRSKNLYLLINIRNSLVMYYYIRISTKMKNSLDLKVLFHLFMHLIITMTLAVQNLYRTINNRKIQVQMTFNNNFQIRDLIIILLHDLTLMNMQLNNIWEIPWLRKINQITILSYYIIEVTINNRMKAVYYIQTLIRKN